MVGKGKRIKPPAWATRAGGQGWFPLASTYHSYMTTVCCAAQMQVEEEVVCDCYT